MAEEKVLLSVTLDKDQLVAALTEIKTKIADNNVVVKQLKEQLKTIGNDPGGIQKLREQLVLTEASTKVLTTSQRQLQAQLLQVNQAANAAKGSYEELLRNWQLAQTSLKLLEGTLQKNADGTIVLTDAYIAASKEVGLAKDALDRFNLAVSDGRTNVGNYEKSLKTTSATTHALSQQNRLTADTTHGITSAIQLLSLAQGQSADKSKIQKGVTDALTVALGLQAIALGVAAGKDLALAVTRGAATVATNAYGVAVKAVTAITEFFGETSAKAWAAATLGLSVLIAGVVLLVQNWKNLTGSQNDLKKSVDDTNDAYAKQLAFAKQINANSAETISSNKKLIDSQIALAQLQGKSAAEVTALKRQALEEDKKISDEAFKLAEENQKNIEQQQIDNVRAQQLATGEERKNLDKKISEQSEELSRISAFLHTRDQVEQDFALKHQILNEQQLKDEKEFTEAQQKLIDDANKKRAEELQKEIDNRRKQLDEFIKWAEAMQAQDEKAKKDELQRQKVQGDLMIAQGGRTDAQILANTKAILNSIVVAEDEAAKKRIRIREELINQFNGIENTLFENINLHLAAELDALQNQHKAKSISDKEYARKRAEIEHKQAVTNKQQAEFSIIINTAEQVVRALKTPVLAAIIAAGGAVQLALVESRALPPVPEFAGGGLTGKKITSGDGVPIKRPNGDNLLATVKTGEVILNEEHQRRLGGDRVFRALGVPGFAFSGFTDGGLAANFATDPVRDNLGMIAVLDLIADKSPIVKVVDINNAQGNVARVESNATI